MPDTSTYKVGDEVYDIPVNEEKDFLKTFPKAQKAQSFTVGKDTFDIPEPEVNEFLKTYPNATSLKKKAGEPISEVSGTQKLPSESVGPEDTSKSPSTGFKTIGAPGKKPVLPYAKPIELEMEEPTALSKEEIKPVGEWGKTKTVRQLANERLNTIIKGKWTPQYEENFNKTIQSPDLSKDLSNEIEKTKALENAGYTESQITEIENPKPVTPTSLIYITGKGYNESAMGLSDAIYNKEFRIDPNYLAKYDPNILEDAAASLVGVVLDLPLFGVGGKIGKYTAKPLINSIVNKSITSLTKAGIEKEIAEKITQNGIKKVLQSSVESGGAMGTYGFVKDALTQWSDPNAEFKDINWSQSLKKGSEDYLLGLAVGASSNVFNKLSEKARLNFDKPYSVFAQAGLYTTGFGIENAMFMYGSKFLEGDKTPITAQDWILSGLTLGVLKVPHIKEGIKTFRKSDNFDINKSNKGEFEVELRDDELNQLNFKNTDEVIRYSSTNDGLANILKNPEIPSVTKAKILWGSKGIDLNKSFEPDKVIIKKVKKNWGVDIYSKDGELLDRRLKDNLEDAQVLSNDLSHKLLDKKQKDNLSNLTTEEKTDVINELKNNDLNIEQIKNILDKPVNERTNQESKILNNFYKITDDVETKIEKNQKRLNLPTEPEVLLSNDVNDILKRIDTRKPILNIDITRAENELYREYKKMDSILKSDRRLFTINQIEATKDKIGNQITQLNEIKNKQIETGEFFVEPLKTKTYERKTERSERPERDVLTDETIIEGRERRESTETAPEIKDEGKREDVTDATKEREIEEGGVRKYPGIPPREDIPGYKTEVREGEGRPPSGSRGYGEEKEGVIPEFVPEGMAEPEPTGTKPETVPIESLKTEPEYFQYKPGAEPETGKIKGEKADIPTTDEPVTVWKEGNTVIEGHNKLEAAKEQGMADVPVKYVSAGSKEEALAKAAAENIKKGELEGLTETDRGYRIDKPGIEIDAEGNILPPAKEPEITKEPTGEPKPGDHVGYKDQVGADQTGTILSKEADGKYRIQSDQGIIHKVTPDKIQPLEAAKKAMREGEKPVEPIPIKEKTKIIAEKLRKGKIDQDIMMVGVPFAKQVWNGAIEVAAKTIETTGDIAKAISDAMDYIKKTDWYQNLDFEKKENAEKKFNSHLDDLLGDEPRRQVTDSLKSKYADIERKVFGSITKQDADFKVHSIWNKILGLPQTLQEKVSGKASEILSKQTAQLASKAITSKNTAIRITGKSVQSVIKNLSKTTEEVQRAEQFIGQGFERSISDANEINKRLREIIDHDKVSLQRIDQALDPEFYKKISYDDFKNELKNEFSSKKFKEFSEDDINKKYQEYLQEMKFDDPTYEIPTYDDLSPQEQKVYDTIRTLYDFVHDTNFAIARLDYPTYLKNKGKYSARFYDAYEMPVDVADQFTEYYKKMQLDIYKKREDLDSWKRAHKLEDPIYAVSKRLYQTMANKSINDYADWIVTHKPDWISPVEAKGFTKVGKGYGDLSNQFVRDEVVEDFRGIFFTNDVINKLYDICKSYNGFGLRQFYKKLWTIYNPGTHVGNVTGNIVFAQLQGINPIRFINNMGWASKEVSSYGPTYRYLLSKGILKSDLTRDDLSKSLEHINNEFDVASQQKNPFVYMGWAKPVVKGIQKVNSKIQDLYSGTDDLAKISAFKSLTDMGLKPEQALDRIANGFQNYQRVGKLYDLTSKLPIIGPPFGKFQGDLGRILRTGIIRSPLNYAATVGTLYGLAYMSSTLSGETKQDRKIREGRLGFPYIPFPDFLGGNIPLAFKLGNNELNVARFLSPLYIYRTPDADDVFDMFSKLSPLPIETVDKKNTANPNGWVSVFMAKNINDPIFAPAAQRYFDADQRGMPILNPQNVYNKKIHISEETQKMNGLRYLARNYVPYGNYGFDFMAAARGENDYYERKRTPAQVVLRFLGYNSQIFDDKKYNDILEKRIKASAYEFVNNAKIINESQIQFNKKLISKEEYDKLATENLTLQSKYLEDIKKQIDKAMPRMSMKNINDILEPTGFGKYNRVVSNPDYNKVILRLETNRRNLNDIYQKSGKDQMNKFIQENNLGNDVRFYEDNSEEINRLERVIDYLGERNISDYDGDIYENQSRLMDAYYSDKKLRLSNQINKLYNEYLKTQKEKEKEKKSVLKEYK